MRTFLKVFVLVLILLVAAVAAIPFFVDPNDYKDEIATQVEKATGRQLTIQGDIGLSVFPWLALQLGEMSLSNANGFEADKFAEVKSADIRIKLMPLFKKELEMDTVILDGLVLNLETDEEGNTNWQDLAGAPSDEPVDEQPVPAEDTPPALQAISIAGVQLSNANILWSDASKGENYQLRNLNLQTDPLKPGDPTALEVNFDLISAKPEVKAHITLASTVMADMKNQRYTLDNLELTTVADSTELPFNNINLKLNANVDADMTQQLVTVREMTLDTKANNAEQEINAVLTGDIDANLGSQQYSIKDLAVEGDISDPALPGGAADIMLSTDVSANLEKQTASLADLAISLQDLIMEGRIDATNIMGDEPAFAGNIQIKPFNLRQLAKDLEIELPEMADPSTLETVALQTQLEGTSNRINSKGLQLTLDQSQLTGQFGIANFSKPAFTFDLNLDKIDADRYLPPVQEGEKPAPAPAKEAEGEAAAPAGLPLETLREINAKGSLKIGSLKVSGITSENIVVTIDAKDGLIKMSPLQADLYQGQYRGNVNLDARQDNLKLSIDERLEGIQAGPLLKDLIDDDKISGTANASVKLTGAGKDIEGIKRSLSGNGKFAFTDGALKGINVAHLIRKAKATLSGQKLSDDAPQKTDFSELSGTFQADNGLITNDDLALMSPLLRLNGSGNAHLVKETIDYGLRVSIVGTAKGQGGANLAELKGLTIPIKIGGTFSEPKPSVDLAALVKEQASDELKSKAEEKLKEKLGDDVGGLLGGALGGKKATDKAADPASEGDENAAESNDEAEAPSAEDKLKEDVKNKLKNLF